MELAKRNLPSDMAGTLCLAFCFVNLSVSFCLVNLNSAQGKGEQLMCSLSNSTNEHKIKFGILGYRHIFRHHKQRIQRIYENTL